MNILRQFQLIIGIAEIRLLRQMKANSGGEETDCKSGSETPAVANRQEKSWRERREEEHSWIYV
jgi:hypothetical protein